MIPYLGEGEFRESIEVFGSADRIRFEADRGWNPIGEVCRKACISDAMFYNWLKKYAGLMPSEMKRIVADLSLDKVMLQDVLAKKL